MLGNSSQPARTLVQKQGQASAMLCGDRLGKDGMEISLSGEPRLILRVEGKAPLEVEAPEKITVSETWKGIAAGPAILTTLADGKARWQQEFELEPLQPGQHDLKLEPLRFREDDGPWREVTWKPLPVRVTTQIKQADIGAARDITSIEEVPAEPSMPMWALAAGTGLVGAAMVLVLWLLRRRSLPQVLPLPPEKAALLEVERIGLLPLVSPQDVQHCHALLSDVVRRYLERRLELPARRQTTPEFLEALRRGPQLTPAQQDALGDFLGRCDLAKFAPVPSPVQDGQAAAALARQLIKELSPPR
jgi:hypothetical protein